MLRYLPLSILQNYKHRIFYSPKILWKAHTKFILGFENSIQQVKRQKCSCEHRVLATTQVWPDGMRALLP